MGKTDWKRLEIMKDEEIDYSDIPPLSEDDAFWASAELVIPHKKTITMRIDPDVLSWFKIQGKGYQSRINAILRAYMNYHQTDL